MGRRLPARQALTALLLACGLAAGGTGTAAERVIVHGTGSSLPDAAAVEAAPAAPRSDAELETLVGPVALYPDDLLAIVLPAATFPLQIVQAARFLDDLEADPTLTPNPDWDESVVALLNYPDVLARLDADLDWTWELGQAVLQQESAVIAAVARFREDARDAGNLRSDERQRVAVDDGAIEIRPADPEALYVPDYEPAVVRTRRITRYRYYPRPYPVYYYPYPAGHHLTSGYFWGLTSAFSIGWHTHHVHVHLHQHRSHPFYGHAYAYRHYRYWRPWHGGPRPYWDHPGRRHHPGNAWRGDGRHQGARPEPAPGDGVAERPAPRRAPVITPRSGRAGSWRQEPPPGRHTATVRAQRPGARSFPAPRAAAPARATAPAAAPRAPRASAPRSAPPAATPAPAAAPAPQAAPDRRPYRNEPGSRRFPY